LRRSRRRAFAASAAVAVVALAAVSWGVFGGSAAPKTASDTSGTTTATVERRALSAHESVDGTLGYADSRSTASAAAGTITRLPAEGEVLKRGAPLFEVGGAPGPVLMYGAKPAWRALRQGISDGADVRQLEANLRALGYDPGHAMRLDGHYDFATRAIVERWQRAAGLPVTGDVPLGQVAFLPGPRRIGKLEVAEGAQVAAGAPVVTTTAVARTVTVKLSTDKQSYVAVGDRVSVLLPDGSTTGGTITGVGKVATTDDQGNSTIDVSVALRSRSVGTGLDQAPVSVSITKETAKDALVVPVTALLAQTGGTYAVEVAAADGTRALVPVTPGLYADGYVEVSGAGIRAGTEVVVPE
jgi:peptidoglycan hydrolase-like protein with peptidoglycan-binding domain